MNDCAPKHQDKPECSIFQKNSVSFDKAVKFAQKFKTTPCELVSFLRLVDLKTSEPEKWEELMNQEVWKCTQSLSERDVKRRTGIFKFLSQDCKMTSLEKEVFNKLFYVASQNILPPTAPTHVLNYLNR